MSKSTKDRVVIITGANSGIGKAAAVKFASEGWRVIMACRSIERSRAAQQEIIMASGNARVTLMQLDIASFESIQRFCSEFKGAHDKLDVLIHNAGFFNYGIKTYQFSPDGLELTFATNVFGPLLMTELLLDHLAASDDPRVLNAGSTNMKHFFDPKRAIEFDNLRGEFAGSRPYAVYKMYGDSKMGLLLLTYRMAEEYKARGIKVNSVMIPQVKVSKETLNRMSGIYRVIGPIIQNLNPFSLAQEEMADCYYHVCASQEFREVTGMLVDAKQRHILPAEGGRLTPIGLIREMCSTRHTPAYANNAANVEQMWRLGREVIGGALC